MKLRPRFPRLVALLFIAVLLAPRSGQAPPPQGEETLARALAARIAGGAREEAARRPNALDILDRYPLTATAAYLLLGDDPNLLRSLYPRIQSAVTGALAPGRMTGAGLVSGAADESLRSGDTVSPALNALAGIELWSLHLIAWKTGAHEDALEYLAWSRRLSAAVAQGLYVPDRARFYPASPSGRPLPVDTPAELLPLVLDETLGQGTRDRIIESFTAGILEAEAQGRPRFDGDGMWRDPLMQPVVLDLLSNIPGGKALVAAAAATISPGMAPSDPMEAAWIDFWRRGPSRRSGLFPGWSACPALANLVLLLDRGSIASADETGALRTGVDSLSRALAADALSVESFAAATSAANALMTRIERLAGLLASPKERWRIADHATWMRLSPRTKRLVTESFAVALVELVRVKTELALRLERGAGIAFRLSLPDDPVVKGDPVPFVAALESARDTIPVSRISLQIGDTRWKPAGGGSGPFAAPGSPIRFAESLALPPLAEPGIIPFNASLEVATGKGRLELWRRESVALVPPYRVSIEFPEGRRLGSEPLPVAITVRYRPDHDIRGTVEGVFMKELATIPPLPARFLVGASSDRVDLALAVSPKESLAPGRYPFSLTVSLETGPVARFEETLVLPIRWLYLGPMTTEETFRRGIVYQRDLLGQYASGAEAGIRWRVAPAEAYDPNGALHPGRLPAAGAGPSLLLYTAVDAPAPMKLRCAVGTADSISLWLNGAHILSSGPRTGAAVPVEPVELRKGPNSILVAVAWTDAPGSVRFDLMDENGYPAAGLDNDLETIVDGFERIAAAGTAAGPAEKAPAEPILRQVSFKLDRASAREVFVIGSFNNWDPAATPMKRDATGLWRAALLLKPGRYPYKFFIDRKAKIVDPQCSLEEPDGFGGMNSVIEVK